MSFFIQRLFSWEETSRFDLNVKMEITLQSQLKRIGIALERKLFNED
jgi:hypothetical protein